MISMKLLSKTKIPTDKLLHFLVSFALMSMFFSFSREMLASIALTLVIGLIKEFRDSHNSVQEKIDDLLANFAGIAAFCLIQICAAMVWNFKDF